MVCVNPLRTSQFEQRLSRERAIMGWHLAHTLHVHSTLCRRRLLLLTPFVGAQAPMARPPTAATAATMLWVPELLVRCCLDIAQAPYLRLHPRPLSRSPTANARRSRGVGLGGGTGTSRGSRLVISPERVAGLGRAHGGTQWQLAVPSGGRGHRGRPGARDDSWDDGWCQICPPAPVPLDSPGGGAWLVRWGPSAGRLRSRPPARLGTCRHCGQRGRLPRDRRTQPGRDYDDLDKGKGKGTCVARLTALEAPRRWRGSQSEV